MNASSRSPAPTSIICSAWRFRARPCPMASRRASMRRRGRPKGNRSASRPRNCSTGRENDGPLGSAVLAHALVRMGHRVTIYTDPPAAPPIEGLIERYGIYVPTVHLELRDAAQQDAIATALDVAVAVERHGGNPNGNLYGVTGLPRHPFRANVDHLFKTMTSGRQADTRHRRRWQ